MNTKIIPFDIELAKKIQAGEIEGKFVTSNNERARILCFDAKSDLFPIVVLVDNGVDELAYSISRHGYHASQLFRLFIELSEETLKCSFVVGDIVYIPEQDNKTVYIIKKIIANEAHLENPSNGEIVQVPLDSIKYYDEYFKKSPKHEFKPFDKVLVRDNDTVTWFPNFFARYIPNNNGYFYKTIGGAEWKYCIPYEGNEHLVGATNDK